MLGVWIKPVHVVFLCHAVLAFTRLKSQPGLGVLVVRRGSVMAGVDLRPVQELMGHKTI
jgi:hypothetical protein